MGAKFQHAKLKPSNKRNILKLWLNGGGKKNVHFPMGNWPYLGNNERYSLGYY